MRALVFDQFGPPDVLHLAEMPIPQPLVGEVVVRVAATTINPTDLMMRSGQQAAVMTHLQPPYCAGMEFTGHIHAVGDNVSFATGTPVIGVVNPRRPQGGAHAEFVVVPAASVAALDPVTDLIGAATIPMNALTALLALNIADLSPGGTLLVTGASGMLGGSVLQLAREAGLISIAFGREGEAGELTGLGASLVLPRGDDPVALVRQHFPLGVDALIDGALIGQQISTAVRDEGLAISLRKSHPVVDPRLRVGYVSVLDGMEDASLLTTIAQLIGKGALQPRLAPHSPFLFSGGAEAFRQVELGGFRGRIVLVPG